MPGNYYHSLLRHSRVRRVSRCSAFGQTRRFPPHPHGWFVYSDIPNFTTNRLGNNTSLSESSRLVSPDATGRGLFSPFPPGFPAVPQYFDHTSVGPSPSQNRTCGFPASGSSNGLTSQQSRSNCSPSEFWA